MEKYDVRSYFINEFVKQLILNSRKEETYQEQLIIRNLNQPQRIPLNPIPIQLKITPRPIMQRRPLIKIPQPQKPIQKRQITPFRQILKPLVRPNVKEMNTRVRETPIQTPEIQPQATGETINLGKINGVLNDRRVLQIECPGPDKFILAKSSYEIQTTRILLTEQEIIDIVKTFAEQAKIPIISGLFKAAVGDFVMTAVISEVVGTRFIITRLSPMSMIQNNNL